MDRLPHLTVVDPAARPEDAAPEVPGGPPSAMARNLVIGALIVMVIASYAGSILSPTLVDDHPAILIALNPINRFLALTSGALGLAPFYVIGFVRLMAPDPFFFLLGRWYGDAGIRWLERRSPSYGSLLRQLERWFHKAQLPIVAFAPNNPICLFAGAAAMSWTAFLVADVVGTVIRLILIRLFSSVFEGPLGSLRGFIGTYRWPLLIVSAVVVGVTIVTDIRAGRTSVGDLAHIDEDIAEAEEARVSPDPNAPDPD
jgi:membrane protein DedA with SNARE-associated domain